MLVMNIINALLPEPTITPISEVQKAELGKTPNAIGTTYLGESENAAALEVVLAQMGVSEDLIGSDSTHIIDCGGTDI